MPPPNQEPVLWTGRPSMVVGIPVFIVCLIFSWLLFPLVVAAARWLSLKCTHYKITSERIFITSGVLSRSIEQIELYRVKDLTVEIPLLLRIFGLGNIRVISTDKSTPVTELVGLAGADGIKEEIRHAVEALRQQKRRIY